jgi:hypothetical protein
VGIDASEEEINSMVFTCLDCRELNVQLSSYVSSTFDQNQNFNENEADLFLGKRETSYSELHPLYDKNNYINHLYNA